uniref:CCHC-type domain-containing protein n=1 Tax=Tanacetum cinerariifolium TaxID=118510 RepID=A0A6L2JAR3_TANCI|nr:hypothetical protein [Tanacetum cinerariifolium]
MHNNIMTAGSRDRTPMLAPGRYPQWRSRFLRYVNIRTNDEALRKCILSGTYKPTTVLVHAVEATDNSPAVAEHTTVKTPANMSLENKAHFLVEKEAIHLILTGIGDDIYSTVDACQTAQKMWEVIERNANPLALVANAQASQDPLYQSLRSHRSQVPSPKPSIPTRSHTSTRHKGKKIVKPITPPSEIASEEDIDPEQAQRDKDMQKNLALIAKYFKKIYKPTNNNLRTSSNSKNKNVDTTPRYKNNDHSGQFGNQRTVNVAAAREKVRSTVVQKSRIQCFNCKEYGHFAKECRKPKRVKDFAYHKEKMLLCKQAEQGVPLQAKQYDCLQHSEQSESVSNTCVVETDDSTVIPDSPDMREDDIQNDQNDVESNDERVMLANLIAKLKLDVDENKTIQKQLKKANITLTQELTDCKAVLAETSNHTVRLEVEHLAQLAYTAASSPCVRLEKEIDELESKKAEFSDMYDVILQECVSKDVMCSYLQSLSDLDALAKLQCMYLHKVKECECLAQKLSKQTESESVSKKVKNDTACNEKASNVFRKEREQYFEIQDLKAQLQDKNIAISELKKLIEKGKATYVDTEFDRPSVVRQLNAQRIPKPSILGVKSPAATVTSSIHSTRALVHSRIDLLPPRNRFRDSISPENSVDEDIDTYVLEDIKADATTVEVVVDRDVKAGIEAGISMEVDVGIDVEDEVESSDRGTMEVGVDMDAGIDIPDGMRMPDIVEQLKQVEEGLQDVYDHVREMPLRRIEDIETAQRQLEAGQLIASRERGGLFDRTRSLERKNLKVRALLSIERDRVDTLRRHHQGHPRRTKELHIKGVLALGLALMMGRLVVLWPFCGLSSRFHRNRTILRTFFVMVHVGLVHGCHESIGIEYGIFFTTLDPDLKEARIRAARERIEDLEGRQQALRAEQEDLIVRAVTRRSHRGD